MILLTGGAGFIGSNILADLNAAGRTDVVIVDRLGTGSKWRNIAKHRFADLIFPEEMEAFLAGRRDVEAVIHMGANSSTTAVDGDAVLRTNLRASMRLWEWCTTAHCQLVYASSAATYGNGSAGFEDREDEEHLSVLRPLNLYGWSKHAFDRWALERSRRGEAPPRWAGLKFFNVYGPNEGHKGDMMSLVAKTFGTVAEGGPVRLFRSHRPDYRDGEQLRDFIYVKDCAAVALWLLERSPESGLYNLGTGQARSFHDLILALAAALGREARIDYVDMPIQIREQYQYFTEAAMTKLRNAGYDAAFHSVEDGVRDYVQNYLVRSEAAGPVGRPSMAEDSAVAQPMSVALANYGRPAKSTGGASVNLDLDGFLAGAGYNVQQTWSQQLALMLQPGSMTDFDLHPEFEEVFRLFTQGDRFRGMDMARLWSIVLNVKQALTRTPGSLAEIGVYHGQCSAVLSHYARLHGRRMYLCDTFQGFAEVQYEVEMSEGKIAAFKDASLEKTQSVVGDYEGNRWIVGMFPQSITEEMREESFAFVSIDCDIYDPIRDGLDFFWPRLCPGGSIFVHDYSSGHWPGATRAVDEFCARERVAGMLLGDLAGTYVLTKQG